MPSLFDPLQLGDLLLPNRIFMAPLTRARCTKEGVPTSMMVEYYAQRSSAGLIIAEATSVSREGLGWPHAPGIWNDEQMQAWKEIVDAVHAKGGKILCQLWHMGRSVHTSFLNGRPPVSSSDQPAPGQAHTFLGKKDHSKPRIMTTEDIKNLVEEYRNAAKNALKAGFDGVEVEAANGYLIDQFLRDSVNDRKDEYGGSVQNRIRLLLEIVTAVIDVYGNNRVGVRMSPNGMVQGVIDSDPVSLYEAAARGLNDIGVAFIELREPHESSTHAKPQMPPIAPYVRKIFKRNLILNSDYDADRAQKILDAGDADAITFGRPYIYNPDLISRIRLGKKVNTGDNTKWYTQGREGYTDYFTWEQEENLSKD